MMRRTLLATSVVLMALGMGSVAIEAVAPAGASTPSVRVADSANPWFCVAIAEINFGYCQYTPDG